MQPSRMYLEINALLFIHREIICYIITQRRTWIEHCKKSKICYSKKLLLASKYSQAKLDAIETFSKVHFTLFILLNFYLLSEKWTVRKELHKIKGSH